MFKVIILISGRGSNMQALVNCSNQNHSDFKVLAVISDKAEAAGISWAKSQGIATKVYDRAQFTSKQEQKRAIFDFAASLEPDLICLAGFMQIVDPISVAQFPHKIINIHPSLLPQFPGLNTHQRAIEAKVKDHGCSVHLVDDGLDTGPVIAQAVVKIEEADSVTSLEKKVLAQEHRLYPWVVSKIASEQLRLAENPIKYSNQLVTEAQELGFRLADQLNLQN